MQTGSWQEQPTRLWYLRLIGPCLAYAKGRAEHVLLDPIRPVSQQLPDQAYENLKPLAYDADDCYIIGDQSCSMAQAKVDAHAHTPRHGSDRRSVPLTPEAEGSTGDRSPTHKRLARLHGDLPSPYLGLGCTKPACTRTPRHQA